MSDAPRILFVEDNPGKRYVVARQLRAHGFAVEEAGTGAAGLELLTPMHDVVVLDMKLPDMHGTDVCRRIKQNPQTASVMVLELSGTFGTAEDRARGLELGADAYLVHPVETIELVATIRALIRLRKAELERERQRELLFGMVSHDLRNPLQTIVMAAHLLGESKTLGESEKRAVSALVRDSDRMSRLIEQLLIFTRNASHGIPVVRTSVDIAEIIERVISQRVSTHEFIVECDDVGPAMLDSDRIEQLLDNLVTNAVRYGTSPVTIRVRRDDDHLELVVHNPGTPIDPAALPTLFDPYRRANKSHKQGAGLGLYIVRQIAEAHRGSVSVRSTAEDGTTFLVRLPLV
jgi:two-component system, sensor histidine kinase